MRQSEQVTSRRPGLVAGAFSGEGGDSRAIAAAAGVVYGLHYDVALKENMPLTRHLYETVPYYCGVFHGWALPVRITSYLHDVRRYFLIEGYTMLRLGTVALLSILCGNTDVPIISISDPIELGPADAVRTTQNLFRISYCNLNR